MNAISCILALALPVAGVEEVLDFGARKYPGRVVPVAEVKIVPQVSGEIIEVAFANGANVKKGDLLYRIDPVKYEAAVMNAESKVAELKANLVYAEKSAVRHTDLIQTRAVSQDAHDSALAHRDAARDRHLHVRRHGRGDGRRARVRAGVLRAVHQKGQGFVRKTSEGLLA